MTKPSKLEIERDRLRRFSQLLNSRATLLDAGIGLAEARMDIRTRRAGLMFWEKLVACSLDVVWRDQQACIEYELKYPLER